ncbi:hypothetical protein B0H16DRAFT_1785017 [Mycena metata]|uniref:DUF6534 domain-containing protein n=1 Tax=Mycena metata TaxID=1033252 RepID=A0AAD7JQR7_9AGAR|nr:hypothetical protein B0H16DRAFT_1785017 [Mycena metata]
MKTNIDNTYGLLFIVAIVSACLYGVGILQFWLYIRKYHSKDRLVLKLLVIAVMVCDTFQQGLLCHAVYKYLVSSISDRAILPTVVESIVIELFFSFAIATLVQQSECLKLHHLRAYIVQILLLENSQDWEKSPLGLCCVFDLLGFNYHYIYSIKAIQLATFEDLLSLRPLSIAGNIIYAIADVTISAVLIILLHSAKTTGFKTKTTDLINRLMVFTFNTGLPTSACTLLSAISGEQIGAFSNTFLYIFFFLLQGRFYTNSLLVTLNCREYIANELGNEEAYSFNLENLSLPVAFVPKRENIEGSSTFNWNVNDLSGTKEPNQ